jgi:hypothetical protein
MPSRLTTAILFAMAALLGSLLALSQDDKASAGSENLRWLAGTGIGSAPASWCFGAAAWHGPGLGADAFAQSSGLCCGYPTCGGSLLNTTVYAWTLGRTDIYSTYYLLGHAYDGSFVGGCGNQAHVQAHWYNPSASSWQVVGYEVYAHTTPTVSGSWFNLWIGSGWWQPSWSAIGFTTWPDPNCNNPPTAEHLHQNYAPAWGSSVIFTHNPSLSINNIYSTWHASALNHYVHNWTDWDQ